MNRGLALVLFALCLLAVGCSKKVVSPGVTTTAPATRPNLAIEEIDFEYFHGKARMVLRDANKEREVKGKHPHPQRQRNLDDLLGYRPAGRKSPH